MDEDGGGRRRMEEAGGGRGRMEEDGGGWRRMEEAGGGRRRMEEAGGGWRRMEEATEDGGGGEDGGWRMVKEKGNIEKGNLIVEDRDWFGGCMRGWGGPGMTQSEDSYHVCVLPTPGAPHSSVILPRGTPPPSISSTSSQNVTMAGEDFS